MRHPDNTPVDEWLSTWLFHKVDELWAKGSSSREMRGPGEDRSFMAMTGTQRRDNGLPINRDEAIVWLKQRGIK